MKQILYQIIIYKQIYINCMKTVKKLLKKTIDCYFKGLMELYRPALEAGVNPFI